MVLMTDRRLETEAFRRIPGTLADETMRKDLEALRRDSDRDLPSLESVVRTATRRPRTWEEHLMTTLKTLSRRPWTSAALAGALAALALLVVPFSYEKTTGHDVTLTLSGQNLDAGRLRGIAEQFKHALHAGGVSVQADAATGGLAFTLSATVPASAGIDAAATAHALGAELTRLGYQASAKVTPVRERVMGSVYAYARDQIIEVNIDHKTAAQIESEIRQGLANAGIDAQVSVTEGHSAGEEKLKLKVEAQKTATGTSGGGAGEAVPQILLTSGGKALGREGFSVREEKRKAPDGVTLTLTVTDGGKTANVAIPHVDTMSDAAITAQVEAQLKAAGIDAKVSTSAGRVTIEHP
jgi:hypothetical protein